MVDQALLLKGCVSPVSSAVCVCVCVCVSGLCLMGDLCSGAQSVRAVDCGGNGGVIGGGCTDRCCWTRRRSIRLPSMSVTPCSVSRASASGGRDKPKPSLHGCTTSSARISVSASVRCRLVLYLSRAPLHRFAALLTCRALCHTGGSSSADYLINANTPVRLPPAAAPAAPASSHYARCHMLCADESHVVKRHWILLVPLLPRCVLVSVRHCLQNPVLASKSHPHRDPRAGVHRCRDHLHSSR